VLVGGCWLAPYNTREGGSDEARALQMGGIGHVDGCCVAPYDKQESGSDIARALNGCRALVPLLWSGTESDPHVSKPTFRVESVKVCLRDLNRPSSRSKATFVSGQAKSGPNRLGFGGP
jgi:hypothetical protein